MDQTAAKASSKPSTMAMPPNLTMGVMCCLRSSG